MEATADMSNDLSKGEKSNLVSDLSTHGGVGDCNRAKLPRISSADAMETWANSQKGKKLYIVLIRIHSLIRGEHMELGRDSDTGGQVKYVVELARALGSMPGVYRIGGGHAVWPIAIQGHYADVGDFAALLSGASNIPMLFTSHSLGQDKLEQLLKQGQLSKDEINTTYKIMHRIEAEELALNGSEIVFTSTIQEIEGQWRLYDGFILYQSINYKQGSGVI
ncbi:hypothetical protein JHK87_004357 [Glycine soja]|nr:hypothetical protein JHK87_004357 [Glycine soja]